MRWHIDRLANSAYGNEEDIKAMLDNFEKVAKPVFKSVNESSYIKFGSMSCNDPKVKIRRGQLTLSSVPRTRTARLISCVCLVR